MRKRKKDWRRDKKLKNMSLPEPKDSLSRLLAGTGQAMFSPAAQELMKPEPGRHIDPQSAEGKAILERIKLNLT